LKSLLLFCVKNYIKIGLFFYFKKIEVRKPFNLTKNDPILFLGNHQNALLDPLIMAVTSGRYTHFLTRAQVFKKPLVSRVLKGLQLIPVYRVRDGWQSIKQNNAIFNQCVSLLSNNQAVTIFPEGSHSLKRTVRPLSKGFTRIVLGAVNENPNTKLQLVPVGFNYEKATSFSDRALIWFGEPILVSKYDFTNENEAIKKLKADLHKDLTRLTTHIETENYDTTLSKLEALQVNFLEPETVNNCIASQFKDCKAVPKKKATVLKPIFKTLLIITCIVPYVIWKLLAQPKVKEIEFMATFRFAIAITLVPLWMVLIAIILAILFSGSMALYFIISNLIIALLAVKL
jgi:1-acyl-sn-glycerol-3-phosphate acyltransferase